MTRRDHDRPKTNPHGVPTGEFSANDTSGVYADPLSEIQERVKKTQRATQDNGLVTGSIDRRVSTIETDVSAVKTTLTEHAITLARVDERTAVLPHLYKLVEQRQTVEVGKLTATLELGKAEVLDDIHERQTTRELGTEKAKRRTELVKLATAVLGGGGFVAILGFLTGHC